MFLIHRLSNGIKKYQIGEKYKEELLIKVFSPLRHKSITGPVDAASAFRTAGNKIFAAFYAFGKLKQLDVYSLSLVNLPVSKCYASAAYSPNVTNETQLLPS